MDASAQPADAAVSDGTRTTTATRAIRLLILVAVYAVVVYVIPRPAAVQPAGWRITGIFIATVVGLMVRPLPGAVVVLFGLCAIVLFGGVTMAQALSGFASPSVWMVLAAMLMAVALLETGLARRIALLFVRLVGQTSLGLSYALVLSDVTLAGSIPSITARSGGIILPIGRSICELFDSTPGPSAPRLGRFLMAALYQSSVVACSMFITGQASNVLAASLAAKSAGVTMTWMSWFGAAVVPGIASCVVVPYVVFRILPPEIRRTPVATDYARAELTKMGPIRRAEAMTLIVIATVCGLWMLSGWMPAWLGLRQLDASSYLTLVALIGVSVLIVTNVLTWDQIVGAGTAWDVFVWYGGLVAMSEILAGTGSTTAFATWVGSWFTGWAWLPVLLLTIGVYFYSHYFFASITAHMLAMFAPFTIMLVGLGAPPALVVYSLACLANLTAGLTHYGTTSGPIVFAQRYVSFEDWWRVGFVASIVNLAIWLTIGFAWWKVLGFW
jgi:divalent anion:Na+ symporter, DASS family